MGKFNIIKIANIGTVKNSVRRTKKKPTEWKKMFENHIANKGLIASIYKKFSKHNSRRNIPKLILLALLCYQSQISTIKTTYRPITLMNIDEKILNKTPAN